MFAGGFGKMPAGENFKKKFGIFLLTFRDELEIMV